MQVHRVLPEWLAQPSVITADIRKSRADLSSIQGLDDDLINNLKQNGITHFFPGEGDQNMRMIEK